MYLPLIHASVLRCDLVQCWNYYTRCSEVPPTATQMYHHDLCSDILSKYWMNLKKEILEGATVALFMCSCSVLLACSVLHWLVANHDLRSLLGFFVACSHRQRWLSVLATSSLTLRGAWSCRRRERLCWLITLRALQDSQCHSHGQYCKNATSNSIHL